jgi:hypothetical protein
MLVIVRNATASAQNVDPNRNRSYNIVLNNVQYTHHNEKMSAGDAVGAVKLPRAARM